MASKSGKNKKKGKNSADQASDGIPILASIVKWLWLLLLVGLLFSAALFVFIANTKMPDTEQLENPKYEQATLILASDGSELGRAYSKNRSLLGFEELNKFLVDALVATEDERFYRHSGIDPKGTLRAVLFLGKRGGASTITQQLSKLFFTNRSRSFVRRAWQKLQEWVIAVQFEKRYTKEEIISMYLNKYEYRYNSFGVGAAANTYFGKDQRQMSVEESAVLISLLKSPNLFCPKLNPENALTRRNVVLKQMVKNELLAQKDYETLRGTPIDLSNFKQIINYTGLAPYFRTSLTQFLGDLFKSDKYRKPDGTSYNIWEDGLRIYTTIDSDIQRHAEESAFAHMKELQTKFDNDWNGRDVWKFSTEKDKSIREKQLKGRKDFLASERRNSDRYKSMRSSMMSDIFNKIKAKIPQVSFDNRHIVRMLNEEKNPGYLKKLLREGYINSNQNQWYRELLTDPLWKELKTKRNELIKKANKVFLTPVKMKVFDYNNQGEKTVTMSPMDSIRYHQAHLQIGSVSIDPSNGNIKSWVGGFNKKYFKLDHVRTNRQVGSTFKPFVYAAAIQRAYSPCLRVQDIRHGIPAGDQWGLQEAWYPQNSDKKYTQEWLSLAEALKKSKNSVSAWLINDLGNIEYVRSLAENLGIAKSKIPPYPSIVLGTPDLNVLEMTAAYATFANNGIYVKPNFITKIEDSKGKLIYAPVVDDRRALNEKHNHAVVNLLRNASSDHKYKLDSDFGGKTGTTNDFVDGWFMGISPELAIGTWVGGENSWIKFRTPGYGYGSQMARPYYMDLMGRLESDPDILLNQGMKFHVPENLDTINFDCAKVYGGPILNDSTVMKKVKVYKPEIEDEFENNEE